MPLYSRTMPLYDRAVPLYNRTVPLYDRTMPLYNRTVPLYNRTVTVHDRRGGFLKQIIENTWVEWGANGSRLAEFSDICSTHSSPASPGTYFENQ